MTNDHGPFCLRGRENSEEWFIIVDGRTFGPWDNKGAARAGFKTEKRRSAKIAKFAFLDSA